MTTRAPRHDRLRNSLAFLPKITQDRLEAASVGILGCLGRLTRLRLGHVPI